MFAEGETAILSFFCFFYTVCCSAVWSCHGCLFFLVLFRPICIVLLGGDYAVLVCIGFRLSSICDEVGVLISFLHTADVVIFVYLHIL